jgi:hypothetical protein
VADEDALVREAILVSQARAALRRGDPASALHALYVVRDLPSRQLVPEELALEAQVLRAMGKHDDARTVTDELKSSYPDSALSR